MAHILVVEDDDLMRKMLREILLDRGHEVHTVASGEEAVAWSSLGKPIDLVLTDVRMEGMGGLAAFEELQRQRPGLRGIVMTGYASEEAPGQAVQAGVWDYLYKPFKEAELAQAVESVLQAEQLQQQSHRKLGSVWEGARRWLKRALGGGVESLRNRAYRGFHAGIRSRYLSLDSALAVWDELERVERIFQESQGEVPLEEEYRRVLQLIQGLKSESLVVFREDDKRRPDQAPVELFEVFYRRIARGELGGHLLPMALSLRTVRADQLVGNPPLRQMVEFVWGPIRQ